jgi:hypothetical protein
MQEWLGSSFSAFLGVTVVLFGFAAFVMGQALANTWRSQWQVAAYAALLGFSDRFIHFALFDGTLLSLSGYLIDTVVLIVIAWFSYRLTRAHRMVMQYPWLYERAGPLGWREKGGHG